MAENALNQRQALYSGYLFRLDTAFKPYQSRLRTKPNRIDSDVRSVSRIDGLIMGTGLKPLRGPDRINPNVSTKLNRI